MLYRTLMRMVERGQTEALAEKLDIFFATNKLSTEEYAHLCEMLNAA